MPVHESVLNKDIPPIFLYDKDIRSEHPLIAGIDEAGRGPLAGPVVASAVILPQGLVIKGLRDSKKTTVSERSRLFWEVTENAIAVGIGIIDADVIDRINILESTRLAMQTAVEKLRIKPDILLIDALKLSNIEIPQKSIIKGESISASIAAASIVAKVVRDDMMIDYHEQYPAYIFIKHKGYSTREHVELINLLGPCPIHRKSFKKVMEMELPISKTDFA